MKKRENGEKYKKVYKRENDELINLSMRNNVEIKKYAEIMSKTILQ
jgi:hypothetical protein